MFDPRTAQGLMKLTDACRASYKKLKPFREERQAALRQFVGHRYGNEPALKDVPINLVLSGTKAYTRKLIARLPKVKCSSIHRELSQPALELEIAVNDEIKLMELGSTLEEVVLNAIFGLGVVKVGITSDGDEGLRREAQVFADCVDLSDWMHDTTARRPEAWQFCGDRYLLPRDFVVNCELFDPEARDKVYARQPERSFLDGDRHDPHETEEGTPDRDSDLYDLVEVWDVWLPREKMVVTYSDDSPGQALRVVDFVGPRWGPYICLGYQKVPNSAMPLPPAQSWMPLHNAVNALVRKAIDDSGNAKTVLGYQAAAEQTATNIRDADNGEIVRMDDPNAVKEFHFRGADAASVQLSELLRSSWSREAGNIDSLSGLGTQSETYGQDKLLAAASSELITDMQERTEIFAQRVVESIAYYLHTDPQSTRPLQKTIPGTDLNLTTFWGPEKRIGEFYQYNIEIEARSMRPLSSEERVGKLNAVLDRLMAMQITNSGYAVDFPALMDRLAHDLDLPELKYILKPADPQIASAMQAQDGGPRMPANTSREYIRKSSSGQQPNYSQQFAQLAASQAAGGSQ